MTQPSLPDPPGTGGLGLSEERNWAMASHIGTVLAAWVAMGFLAPLGILLVMGGRSEFVRRHAVESLNFQITLLIYLTVAMIVALSTLGLALLIIIPVGALAAVLALIVIILATMAASRGDDYRYPLTFHFVK